MLWVVIVLGQAVLMPFLLQVSLLASLFGVTAAEPVEWLVVVGLSSLGFILSELAKIVRGKP